jgi:hypothetical protein
VTNPTSERTYNIFLSDTPLSELATRSGRRIFPSVCRHTVADRGALFITKDLQCRERPIGNCALLELSIRPVGKELEAFELMTFDGALPVQESGVRIELALENIFARVVAIAAEATIVLATASRPTIAFVSSGLCMMTSSARRLANSSGVA